MFNTLNSISGLLLVAFICLKLTNVIAWSWLMVILLPFAIEFGIAIALFILVAIGALGYVSFESILKKNK